MAVFTPGLRILESNLGKKGGESVCSVQKVFFSNASNNETFLQQLLSLVVDRASTFLVGVPIPFWRQVRIKSKLSVN